MISQDAPAQVADGGVGGTEGQASRSYGQRTVVKTRAGRTGPYPGEPPVDLFLGISPTPSVCSGVLPQL